MNKIGNGRFDPLKCFMAKANILICLNGYIITPRTLDYYSMFEVLA